MSLGHKSNQYKSKKWLEQQYKFKSMHLIAYECGCATTTIHRWIKKHGIKTHDKSRKTIRRIVKYPLLQDAKWLKQRYIDEKLSTEEIAKMVGSSSGNVRCALQYAKIPIRGVSDGIIIKRQRNFPELWNKNWLLKEYEKGKRTILSLADEIGCHPMSVARSLDKHGIKRRKRQEVQNLINMQNHKGSNAKISPRWQKII